MERKPKEPVSKWNLLYCMHLRPLRSIKKCSKVSMKTVILSSRRIITTHAWNSQSILEFMGRRWRTLDLVWLYMQQLWRSWTFHYFYSFLFILHLKDILWIFFTYEKINSWPSRNTLSGTVSLLKERSLQHSIKLVNI